MKILLQKPSFIVKYYSGQTGVVRVQVRLCQRESELLRHDLPPDERGGHAEAHHRVLQHDPLQLRPKLQGLSPQVPQPPQCHQSQSPG